MSTATKNYKSFKKLNFFFLPLAALLPIFRVATRIAVAAWPGSAEFTVVLATDPPPPVMLTLLHFPCFAVSRREEHQWFVFHLLEILWIYPFVLQHPCLCTSFQTTRDDYATMRFFHAILDSAENCLILMLPALSWNVLANATVLHCTRLQRIIFPRYPWITRILYCTGRGDVGLWKTKHRKVQNLVTVYRVLKSWIRFSMTWSRIKMLPIPVLDNLLSTYMQTIQTWW